MPKFVIERNVPGAGKWSDAERKAAATKSNETLRALGPDIQWQESFVVEDKVYCVYVAANRDLVLEHAQKSGFPADRVSEIRMVLDPTSED